jgi:hypothetical protein
LAGSVIASALLDILLEKDIITLNEVGTLDRALKAASLHSQIPEGREAMQLIGVMIANRHIQRSHSK